jgi:hypothetical protein
MSELPGWEPGNYQEPASPYGNGPLLVKLAAIFNLIMAGLDAIYGLLLIGVSVLLVVMGRAPAGGAEMFRGASGEQLKPEEARIMAMVYGGMAVLALAVAVVKLIAGIKLLRRSHGAWGWGLTAGIVGCVQIWCSLFCILPLGVGIYTIIAMSMETTRRYLASARAESGQDLAGM